MIIRNKNFSSLLSFEEIYKRTTGHHKKGDSRIVKVIYDIFLIKRVNKIYEKDILLTTNPNSYKETELLFKRKLHPYRFNRHFFSAKGRINLFKSLIVYLINWNKMEFSIRCSRILSKDLSLTLPSDANIYFWNPYTITQYILVNYLRNVSFVYIHTPYYPVFEANYIFSNWFVSEVYDKHGINICNTNNVTYKKECPNVRFYFSQLKQLNNKSIPKVEMTLRKFADFLISKGVDIDVYLHYLDRQSGYSNSNKLMHIKKQPSFDNLCKTQLSFSGGSSIGYELLGLKLDHYIFHRHDILSIEMDNSARFSDNDHILKNEDFEEIYNNIVIKWLDKK